MKNIPRIHGLRITSAKVLYQMNTISLQKCMRKNKYSQVKKKKKQLQNQNHKCLMEWLKLQHYLYHLNSTTLDALDIDYGVGFLKQASSHPAEIFFKSLLYPLALVVFSSSTLPL